MKNAYFAGGCFWCVTPIFKIQSGVEAVVSGFSGGDEAGATYADVKAQRTGHRETVKIVYDEDVISYEKLLDIFLANVDVEDGEGQFIDRGRSYTLAVYYNDGVERAAAEKKIEELKKTGKVEVAVEPFKFFIEAPEEHQDYYLKNPEAFGRELEESGRRSRMMSGFKEKLAVVTSALDEADKYYHAANVLSFDLETICPSGAMERQGECAAFLSTEGYKKVKTDEFIAAAEYIYEHRGDAEDPLDAALAEALHRDYLKTKNITPEMSHEFALVFNKSYLDWLAAKEKSDYSLFEPSLGKVRDTVLKDVSLRDGALPDPYDEMLSDYERGMTSADLDEAFGLCKERLLPLLERIKASGKTIRRDFMSRHVTDEAQGKFAKSLLDTIGYDFARGAFTTTEHPFTSDLARDDVRVTTHYYPDAFASSMYSIVHEGGHALFGQLQPAAHHDHHVSNRMTMGMHESVSRFYENRIGRSREFVSLIYPEAKRTLGVLDDVTPEELYEAVNVVEPSLIRTEADEFTYTFHVIIRYEIEKMIVSGEAALSELPRIWREKYEKYLGVRPASDREGVLQDVHWSGGFGYFPTYALGNMYNSMYFNRMKNEFDVSAAVSSGDFAKINGWMAENVFKKANLLPAKEWIKDITGRDFTPVDFLDYLEEKYGELYAL